MLSIVLLHQIIPCKFFYFLILIICQGPNKFPDMEKASMLRTLKDHLNQCPIKLSEEMVRCMAAVYCWLCGAASTNPGRNRSPLLSRSSTNVVLPRHGVGEECEWSCKSMVEISWIATDKSQFSCASYAINNYRFVPWCLHVRHILRIFFKLVLRDNVLGFPLCISPYDVLTWIFIFKISEF